MMGGSYDGVFSKLFFPKGQKWRIHNHFFGGLNRPNVFEDFIGDSIRRIKHKNIIPLGFQKLNFYRKRVFKFWEADYDSS
jgi:hypothetical protein